MPTRPRRREPLTRERVIDAAIALADEHGIEAVSMRRLGGALGVEAMSLYKHVPDKDAILDGMARRISARFEPPSLDDDWRTSLRRSLIAAHAVLLEHPWASALLESRLDPGPERLAYLDAVIAVLRAAGFEMPLVAQAFMALDAHLYGFTLQVQSFPFDAETGPDVAAAMVEQLPADRYPNIIAMGEMVAAGPRRMPVDYEFGLDLLLDGLERLRPT